MATIVSFDALMGSAGAIGGQLGMGYISRMMSISVGYITGGLAVFIAVPIIATFRRLEQPAEQLKSADQ